MINIAIDGPSGAGKGSVAKLLSRKLNFYHFDTGALYRAVALYCFENNIQPDNEQEVGKALDKINIEVKFDGFEQYTLLNGVCINNKIRTSQISNYVYKNSVLINVRKKVENLQKDFAKINNVIMEGRDITTQILPNAKYKFFLTASPEIRAKRRHIELLDKGENITFEQVLKDINERDFKDSNRELGRLYLDKDVILVNTDNLNIEEAAQHLYNLIEEK